MLCGSLKDVEIIQINGTIMMSDITVSTKYMPTAAPNPCLVNLGVAFTKYPPLSELPLQQRQNQYDHE